jgi:hypothetical protein
MDPSKIEPDRREFMIYAGGWTIVSEFPHAESDGGDADLCGCAIKLTIIQSCLRGQRLPTLATKEGVSEASN